MKTATILQRSATGRVFVALDPPLVLKGAPYSFALVSDEVTDTAYETADIPDVLAHTRLLVRNGYTLLNPEGL